MLTNYDFRRPFRVCGLDCLFSLRVRRTVSTPFRLRRTWLGISLSRRDLAFPEFDEFYLGPHQEGKGNPLEASRAN